ncbi:acyloxyacyl hydrolase [Xenopus laevis]|uniref:Acyloxyacyl hydrolase n=2 Tax=Xenopus laevis TaxID=8355 RepID=A0A1L8FWX8_XENLA|nr:acyloxyacyl hydrolase [Xenopus laevis]OCT76092.1 hypothetical protein XELAEV_18031280mg [Xenopus laevis]
MMNTKGTAAVFACLLLIQMSFLEGSEFKSSHGNVGQNHKPIHLSFAPNRDTCIGCVLMVTIIEQLAQVHNNTVQEAMTTLCGYLPEEARIRSICILLTELFGPDLIKLINHKLNADVICHAVNLCSNDPGQPFCHVFEKPKVGLKRSIKYAKNILEESSIMKNAEVLSLSLSKICKQPLLRRLCETESSLPLLDIDQDNFSVFPSLRGYHWRGRDCNDTDNSVYPGRRPEDWDLLRDSNCNGIWGFDPEDKIPYEKKFCEGTDSKGIIVLGDSAAVHFHIPPEWLTAINMSEKTFSNLPLAISNEIDWPQFSMYTGYQNSTIGGWTESLYLQLRKNNLCNHRDYQNLSKNGYSSRNLKNLKSVSRDQELDKPAVVFYAVIGNDVCNTHADTLRQMTTPKQMHINVMTTLENLDTLLPKGSHVVLVALAAGHLLWDTLHDKYHPIGQLNKDVTYNQLYSFLSCLKSNPCEGWMNKNETVRNLTTERANQLSDVLKEIAVSQKFNNFDVIYIDRLYERVFEKWRNLGKDPVDLIEPVDGFHPNQIASALGADLIWKEVINSRPEVFGKNNPYNEEITATFGDQGGH